MKHLHGDTVRAVLLVLLHAAVLVVLIATPVHRWIDEVAVRGFVEWAGWYGPAALLGLCALTPLVMMPRWPLAMAAGILYGWRVGGALANVGSTAGAVVGLLFARYMARSFVARRLGRYRHRFDRLTDRYGVGALIILRAFPFSNFVITNALAGVSKIRVLPYAAASFLGMIPSSFLYALMGKVAKRPEWWLLALFGGVFVGFTLLTMMFARRFLGGPAERRAMPDDSGPTDPPAEGRGR